MSEDTQDAELTAEQAERKARRDALIQPLIEAVTQREKYLLADRLSKPYSEIMQDPDRIMLALAWKKLKTTNGGIAPNFEDLLDKTDAEILEVLGLDDDDAEAADAAGEG